MPGGYLVIHQNFSGLLVLHIKKGKRTIVLLPWLPGLANNDSS